MSKSNPTIFVSAAEASGDAHAAKLIRELRRRRPDARLVGVGGPQMAAAGCEILFDPTDQASMLLGGPLLKLGYYCRLIRRIKRRIAELRPDVHVPVDSPALNWHLAAASKRSGAKVVYYIAPQVWAWAPWRVKKIIRLTDHVACILPFEQDWLRQRGVKATYVGHPLFDDLPERPGELPNLLRAFADGQWRVVLLAGSRPAEIHHHARALAATAGAIRNRWPDVRCIFAPGTERAAGLIRARLRPDELANVEIVAGQTAEQLAHAHFALAVSGTITLKVAHFGVPMVVVYRASRLMYQAVGRWLLRTPHLSLVNILAGRRIVPELMPWHGSRRQLTSMAMEMLEDLGGLVETRQSLLDVTAPLHPGAGQSASANAAELVLAELG